MRAKLSMIGGVAIIALFATAIVAAPAGAKTKTKTFSNPTPVAIPDATLSPPPSSTVPGAVFDDLSVGKKGTIKDINVGVQVAHPDTGDLELWLFKGEKYIPLAIFAEGGSSSANIGSGTACTGGITLFDGAATLQIFDGLNPFDGSFRPEQNSLPLGVYNGDQLKGTWKLLALDFDAPPPLETGTINCFQLTAKYKTG